MTFNTNPYLALECQNNIGPALPQAYQITNFFNPSGALAIAANTWYHFAWVFSQPNFVTYTAQWTAYVNGVQSVSTPGLFPLPIVRDFAFLGGSDWADANLIAVYDVVRVYDYALNASTVATLASQYLTAPPPPISSSGVVSPSSSAAAAPTSSVSPQQSSAPTSSPVTFTTSSPTLVGGGSSSSSLSGGAIAGIVIGGVVGVLLLCSLLFFFCTSRGKKQNKSMEGGEGAGGEGSYDHVEPSTTSAAGGGETHDAEVEMA